MQQNYIKKEWPEAWEKTESLETNGENKAESTLTLFVRCVLEIAIEMLICNVQYLPQAYLTGNGQSKCYCLVLVLSCFHVRRHLLKI